MTTKMRPSKPVIASKVEIKKSADFKSIYVNWAQGTSSPYDVLLNLGEASPGDSGGTDVEHKVRVIFSPLEAKMVAYILAKTLQEYEAQFGTIMIPGKLALQMRALMPTQNNKSKEQAEGE